MRADQLRHWVPASNLRRPRLGGWRRVARAARWVVGVLLALELAYAAAANSLLTSGAIQRAASADPESLSLSWKWAFSPWPGRAYVSGLRLRSQDPSVRFGLSVDSAKVDVVLWDLFRQRFHASNVRAEGVSYRVLAGSSSAGTFSAKRQVTFPSLEEFATESTSRPTLVQAPTTTGDDEPWTAHLDDVQATVNELWVFEYRYRGVAHTAGAFALTPLRQVWVGPAVLSLDGGELTVGDHVLSRALTAHAAVTIRPVDLRSWPWVIHQLTTSIQFDTPVADLGVADLYVDGLRVRGEGRLAVDLQVADGRLQPGSTVEAWLPSTDVNLHGYHFLGLAHATMTISSDTRSPAGHATLKGVLNVPLQNGQTVSAALSDVSAELVLADGDLTQGLSLARLSAVLGEARVRDARAITPVVGSVVPIFAPLVLGDGPLVASGSARVTPGFAVIRVKHLRLGDAALEGALVSGASGWTGVAGGHFGQVPIGVRLRNAQVEGVLFTPPSWLATELLKFGIKPE